MAASFFDLLFGSPFSLWPFTTGNDYTSKRIEYLNDVKSTEHLDAYEMRFSGVKPEDEENLKVSIRKNFVNVTCQRETESGYYKYEASRTIPDYVDPTSAIAELGAGGLTITFKKKALKPEPEPENQQGPAEPKEIKIDIE